MAIKIGINGFRANRPQHHAGRNGQQGLRFRGRERHHGHEDAAHLLKYDSILGNLEATIEAGEGWISVDGDRFQVLSQKDPAQLPWKDLASSWSSKARASSPSGTMPPSTSPGAGKRVIITAPATAGATFVMGVNQAQYDAAKHVIV